MIDARFPPDAPLRGRSPLALSARRCGLVAWRNVTALRSAYWLVVVSGFIEPLLYLLSIGVGVGALIGHLTLPGGRVVDYPVFVAPAMLAASAMNGATVESTFHFFSKLKYMRLYDAMLFTPRFARRSWCSASRPGRWDAARSTAPSSSPSWWPWS